MLAPINSHTQYQTEKEIQIRQKYQSPLKHLQAGSADKQSSPTIQGNEDGGKVIVPQKNQADNKLPIEMTDQKAFQTGGGLMILVIIFANFSL